MKKTVEKLKKVPAQPASSLACKRIVHELISLADERDRVRRYCDALNEAFSHGSPPAAPVDTRDEALTTKQHAANWEALGRIRNDAWGEMARVDHAITQLLGGLK